MSDERIRAAHPDACALICAVHDHDAELVEALVNRCDIVAVAIVLAAMVPDDAPSQPFERMTIGWLMRVTAEALGVELDEMLSPSRERRATRARQIACYVARESGYTFSAIGHTIGRDHSTVMTAVRKVNGDTRLSTMAQIVLARIDEEAA